MIDEKKLIEDLLNNDGMNFTVKLHDFTPEGVGCFLREYTDKLKEGFIDLINAQPKVESWIPVAEQLPKKSGYCLCYWHGHTARCKFWRQYPRFEFNGREVKVTHWMPLPEPPKEGEP